VGRSDRGGLCDGADEFMAQDAMVRDAIKESLAQFFPTIRVDRDRFPTLETVRARYVLCTRAIYDALADDVFEGCHHLETENPFNVLVTDHEDGLPFIALSYMHRAAERYRAMLDDGRAALRHPTA